MPLLDGGPFHGREHPNAGYTIDVFDRSTGSIELYDLDASTKIYRYRARKPEDPRVTEARRACADEWELGAATMTTLLDWDRRQRGEKAAWFEAWRRTEGTERTRQTILDCLVRAGLVEVLDDIEKATPHGKTYRVLPWPPHRQP